MIKKASPDSPVFSELQALMEQADNEPYDMPIPEKLEDIALTIVKHKGQMAKEAWIIGRLLLAAKEKLTVHGEWLDWLSSNVDITDWQAERYMKLAREYPNPTAPSILGQTKALEITKIPEPERDAFLQKPHLVDGQEKSVVQMTTRELEKAVKNWLEPKAADADDYSIPPVRISHGIRKYYDDGDSSCWDSASSEQFSAELDVVQAKLQEMEKIMVNMKGFGPPGKPCVEKLRDIHMKVLDCLSLAGVENVVE